MPGILPGDGAVDGLGQSAAQGAVGVVHAGAVGQVHVQELSAGEVVVLGGVGAASLLREEADGTVLVLSLASCEQPVFLVIVQIHLEQCAILRGLNFVL